MLIAGILLAGFGLLIEDLGGWIEVHVIERSAFKDTKLRQNHDEAFNIFLTKKYQPELIGMRYIDSLTIRMKFELGTAIALFFSIFGMISLIKYWQLSMFWLVLILLGCFILIFYLLWEAEGSFCLRSKYRKILFLPKDKA